MDELSVKSYLEGLGIDGEKIDETIIFLKENMSLEKKEFVGPDTDNLVAWLKTRIDETDDWRKKASLAARIINLEQLNT
jgi:hypothetical protein